MLFFKFDFFKVKNFTYKECMECFCLRNSKFVPLYPNLQLHVYFPIVFEQSAFTSHLCVPCLHSLISLQIVPSPEIKSLTCF